MDDDDDVLSLSAHGESLDGDSSSMATDLSDMLVVDEVGYESADLREVHDEGIYRQYAHQQSSVGAIGLTESAIDDTSDLTMQVIGDFKSRRSQCSVCSIVTHGKMRRHVLKQHLPWFWEPHTACWSCEVQEAQAGSLAQRHTMVHGVDGSIFDDERMHLWCQLMLGSLHHVREWFGCPNLDDLLGYVVQRQLHTFVRSQFSTQETRLLTFLADNYCPTSMPTYTSNPPNHPICIFNWEVISILLARATRSQQQDFIKSKQRMTYEGANITDPTPVSSEPLLFVDSHFHLDLILRRMRLQNFQNLQSAVACHSLNRFDSGVANYVFPSKWDDWASDVGEAQGVYVSFGIHPHIAAEGITNRQLVKLDTLTNENLCVAIGEIGIDYTSNCICRPCRNPVKCREDMFRFQEEAFIQMLLLAQQKKLPVILHCRDSGDGSAAARTLEIIFQHDLQDLSYYRHCFVGSLEELAAWQKLPNIVFGISGKFIRDNIGLEVIPRILHNQLVLETDAPFLSPFRYCPVNHPWNLPRIATAVSRLRNTPLHLLLDSVNDNARNFFRITSS